MVFTLNSHLFAHDAAVEEGLEKEAFRHVEAVEIRRSCQRSYKIAHSKVRCRPEVGERKSGRPVLIPVPAKPCSKVFGSVLSKVGLSCPK